MLDIRLLWDYSRLLLKWIYAESVKIKHCLNCQVQLLWKQAVWLMCKIKAYMTNPKHAITDWGLSHVTLQACEPYP